MLLDYIQHFQVQLLDHLLARIRGRPYSWDEIESSEGDLTDVDLKKDRIYAHGAAQFNYTTYDVRRSQDTIKPALRFTSTDATITKDNSNRCHVMLASSVDDKADSSHSFWYAKVLGIFHCEVRDRSIPSLEEYERKDILWVRWLGADPEVRAGWKAKRLERVGYVPHTEDVGAFGFVDPADVIRSAHLIPAFHHLTRDDLLVEGSASLAHDFEAEDYSYFYVNR